jgi:hypothetical protein
MKTAIVLAALLAVPMHSWAQSDTSYFGGRAQTPVCVYKGVMSDAEIEACTGYRVRYGYDDYPGPVAARVSTGGTARHLSYSRQAPRRTRH